MTDTPNPFGITATLTTNAGLASYLNLAKLAALTGFETVSISGISSDITPQQNAHVSIVRPDKSILDIDTLVRIDATAEVDYFRNGGILNMVLRQLLSA